MTWFKSLSSHFSLRWAVLVALILVAVMLGRPQPAQALNDCSTISCNKDGDPKEFSKCNANLQACLQNNINELQGQATTLNSTIQILNGQIKLQESQINQTKAEINQLENEINDLGDRIDGLNISLDKLGEQLVDRVGEDYRLSRTNANFLVLASDSLNNFLSGVKYLQVTREQTLKSMQDAEVQKTSYDEQKSLKEQKQAEVEKKQALLQSQQNELTKQRAVEQNLLDETKNNESQYQALLADAKAQLASIEGYVTSQGGASILSNQTVCNDWGCYYNQRDSSWGNMSLGGSATSVAEAGCLISSSAMVASHYKRNLTPKDIASDTSAFSTPYHLSTNYNLNKTITVNGVTISRFSYTSSLTSVIDGELSQGKPVIVGLYNAARPSHFIVLKSGSNGDYVMNDPFMENGHDVNLTVKYKLSDIKRVDKVTVN